jgi:hypothetical protein
MDGEMHGSMRVYQDLGRRPHGLQAASTYNGMDQRV